VNSDFRVGPWTVRPSLNILSQNGTAVRLEPKVMEVLVCLASKPGSAIPKEEILKAVWPDTFVTDDVLIRSISELRRVFGDSPRDAHLIETIPKRGYRLVAPVEAINGDSKMERNSSLTAPKSNSITVQRSLWIIAMIGALVGFLMFGRNLVTSRLATPKDVQPSGVRSLVVLPFQNLSGDPSQDYFVDGMTEELITEVSQIRTLRVVSRTSAMQYKKTSLRVPEIARALGVESVLEGSVLRSGDRVRITTQLIYAPSDTHLWAQSYERDIKDVLSLQAEIAADVATRVETQIGHSRSDVQTKSQVDPRAYEAISRVTIIGQSIPDQILSGAATFSSRRFPLIRILLGPTGHWETLIFLC
jgi:TolB-like protein/DNA-binding winged helix-turn-helix (wHTH) protein